MVVPAFTVRLPIWGVVIEASEKSKDWEWSGCPVSPFSPLPAFGIGWWNLELRDSKGIVCRGFQRSTNAALRGICSLWFSGSGETPGKSSPASCFAAGCTVPGAEGPQLWVQVARHGAGRTAPLLHHLGDFIWLLERACFSPEQIPYSRRPL